MKPGVYIVVRKTTDWTNEAGVRAQLPDGFAPLVDLWNDTFAMPYHRFRAQLKEIAQANLKQVEGAAIVDLEEVPTGALIAPTDDDDWFAPTMAGVVATQASGPFKGYYWPSRFLEVPPNFEQWLGAWRRRLLRTPQRWLCTTNNYVIENTPETAPLVGSHLRATEWFLRNSADVRKIEVPLSLQNRNIASQTALLFGSNTMMTRRRLLRRHRQYRALYARAARRLPSWCTPHVAAMMDLMDALTIRRW